MLAQQTEAWDQSLNQLATLLECYQMLSNGKKSITQVEKKLFGGKKGSLNTLIDQFNASTRNSLFDVRTAGGGTRAKTGPQAKETLKRLKLLVETARVLFTP